MKSTLDFGSIAVPVEEQVRISTLNILHNPNMIDDRLEHLIQNLNSTQPDIFCLQEVIFESDTDSLFLKKIEASTNLKNVVSLKQNSTEYGNLSGCAIMSSMDVVDSGTFHLQTESKVSHALYAVMAHGNNVVIAITAHLTWGGHNEQKRVRQVTTVNAMAEALKEQYSDQNPLVVFAGDFNTDPDGDTIRYLTGKGANHNGDGTFWTDGWSTHGTRDNEHTMVSSNHWAIETAFNKEIFIPQFMPNRRIDYMLSYGWNYGKHGTALNFMTDYDELSKYGYPISDHKGITVDYWVKSN